MGGCCIGSPPGRILALPHRPTTIRANQDKLQSDSIRVGGRCQVFGSGGTLSRFGVEWSIMETSLTETQKTTAPPETDGAIPVIREYIGVKPGYCGGKPHILGHRIKVEDVAIWHERMKMSPSEIVDQYPSISLAQVHAALAYYHGHRDEIEDDIREADEFVEKLRAGQPSIFERVRQRNAQNSSLPPG
jgi:uncharacterized protein (DUF433 family)